MEKGAELTEKIGKMKKAEEESKARIYSLMNKCHSVLILNTCYINSLGFQVRGGRIRDLEEELRLVKAELQQEKEEKVDLVTEKVGLVKYLSRPVSSLLCSGKRRGGMGS